MTIKNILLILILVCFMNLIVFILNNSKNQIKFHKFRVNKLRLDDKKPGQLGAPVFLINDDEKNLSDLMIKEYSYNTVVSDKISLDRSLPDTRPKECLEKKYSSNLPAVSVIIVFHDEYLSFLLRTIHSVINRTPVELLKEVILVDDCSTKGNTDKENLDWHILTTFPYKNIRILRLQERHGLMKARMVGVLNSTSDIVVVMDAHMEVNTNWLPPLIEPIIEDFATITEPVIDYIDWNTLEYRSVKKGTRGGFNWQLCFLNYERKIKPGELQSDDYPTPVILGAIAAFNKEYFWKLGGYDPGLKIWGGEQYELSFKAWMCGGKVIRIPCSRVGHNYKGSGFHPYVSNNSFVQPNMKRIVEVWFDEFKYVYYTKSNAKDIDAGYLLPQIELRQKLGCKSFKWYLDTVFPEFLTRFPIDFTQYEFYGSIQSMAFPEYCIDDLGALKNKPIGLYQCHFQDSQFFFQTNKSEIRLWRDSMCLDTNILEPMNNTYIIRLFSCHHRGGNQYFAYDSVNFIQSNESNEIEFEEKIDWVNHTFIEIEKARIGLGELGTPVLLDTDEEKNLSLLMIKEYSYNTVVSDKISLDRSLRDTRAKECHDKKYSSKLPAVSVIIVFHDEYLSFLLRTLHSVINRTPVELLKEVILVDDCSKKGNTDKDNLDWHILTTFPYKNIRILRLQERHGLMKARMVGVLNSTSDIVVVMDAHIEVNTNWLPPLIEPIIDDPSTINEPVVDFIEWDTLELTSATPARGGFNWGLIYQEYTRKMKPGELESDNFPTPVILGAIAAFNKEYFWKLGGYDPGLKIWGGEQYDLSFKAWMCGGKVLRVPCSRVGHNFKGSGFHPYTSNSSFNEPNMKRIVDVWFDNFKDVYYSKSNAKDIDAGYLIPQIELRQKLGCKGFKWYLDNIFPDFFQRYPTDMTGFKYFGPIQSMANKNYCIDTLSANNNEPIGLYTCHFGETQFFLQTDENAIRTKADEYCFDVVSNPSEDTKKLISIYYCHHSGGNQFYKYDEMTQQIKNPSYGCIQSNFTEPAAPEMFLAACDDTLIEQKWMWNSKRIMNMLENELNE
uniref:CSON005670 protein n=1 Tax=Culicoides sonorensis TaxID=179676 RepID=A0A336MT90_CULSO